MATDFIMPRLADQAPAFYPSHSQSHSQSSHQSISPLSPSGSPTSPTKAYHGRQLRPLFFPAVLRPTEYPSRIKKAGGQDDDPIKTSSSFMSLSGLSALGRLSRRSTGDSGKCMDGEWKFDMFPQVSGEPTRQHWKPDTESDICDEPSCMRHFSYWTRRHHCRKCGNIFCDFHSNYSIPLDQDANYNPKGTISRACSHCYSEFKSWRSRTNSQASSEDSAARMSQTAPPSPQVSSPTAVSIKACQMAQLNRAEIAASVPRDWNWSTF